MSIFYFLNESISMMLFIHNHKYVELFAATKNGKELTRAIANSTKAQHNIQRKNNRYSRAYISLSELVLPCDAVT